jgi:uncharacterized protein (DUF1697 family)
MPRYAAMLRGVSPTNCSMPALRRCCETLGFRDVETVLASGNVVFTSRVRSQQMIERMIERGTQKHLGKPFLTVVRSIEDLQALVEHDPFARKRVPPSMKRVVTFLRAWPGRQKVLAPLRGAQVVTVRQREVFTAYVRQPGDAAFMELIEKSFGTHLTTRSWDTVVRIVRVGLAARPPAKPSSRSTRRAPAPRPGRA